MDAIGMLMEPVERRNQLVEIAIDEMIAWFRNDERYWAQGQAALDLDGKICPPALAVKLDVAGAAMRFTSSCEYMSSGARDIVLSGMNLIAKKEFQKTSAAAVCDMGFVAGMQLLKAIKESVPDLVLIDWEEIERKRNEAMEADPEYQNRKALFEEAMKSSGGVTK